MGLVQRQPSRAQRSGSRHVAASPRLVGRRSASPATAAIQLPATQRERKRQSRDGRRTKQQCRAAATTSGGRDERHASRPAHSRTPPSAVRAIPLRRCRLHLHLHSSLCRPLVDPSRGHASMRVVIVADGRRAEAAAAAAAPSVLCVTDGEMMARSRRSVWSNAAGPAALIHSSKRAASAPPSSSYHEPAWLATRTDGPAEAPAAAAAMEVVQLRSLFDRVKWSGESLTAISVRVACVCCVSIALLAGCGRICLIVFFVLFLFCFFFFVWLFCFLFFSFCFFFFFSSPTAPHQSLLPPRPAQHHERSQQPDGCGCVSSACRRFGSSVVAAGSRVCVAEQRRQPARSRRSDHSHT